MKAGELETAKRRALNIFDEWVNVTGFVVPHTGYYYELSGIIEDAVHCGAQAATGDMKRLDSEEGLSVLGIPNESSGRPSGD